MYIHLTTHSAYSLLEGLPLPAELAQAAKASGMTALGLTDHRTLTGTIEFIRACNEADIQPILGLDIDLATGGRLPLLAVSLEGWSNLCRLSSALALQENSEAPCTLELLAQYAGDLVALAHNEETFGALKDIFTKRLYATLTDPARGLPRTKQAAQFGLPLVASHPVYYLQPEQANLQRTLAAIRLVQPIATLPPDAIAPPGAYFASAAEMEMRLAHFPKAIRATQEITEREPGHHPAQCALQAFALAHDNVGKIVRRFATIAGGSHPPAGRNS